MVRRLPCRNAGAGEAVCVTRIAKASRPTRSTHIRTWRTRPRQVMDCGAAAPLCEADILTKTAGHQSSAHPDPKRRGTGAVHNLAELFGATLQ
jgi:hypothetical protein